MPDVIDQYRPDMPDEAWDVVASWVRTQVRRAKPATPQDAKRAMGMLARFARWAWQDAGYALEEEHLLTRDVIVDFTARGLPGLSDATRGTYRAHLLRLARILRPRDPDLLRVDSIGSNNPRAPYSPQECAELRSWARGQASLYGVVNANVLLALGLGAGLSTSEIAHVTAQDVTVDDEGVLIHVRRGRVRDVPVLERWESVVADVARSLWRPEAFLFRTGRTSVEPNIAYNFISRSRPCEVGVTVQRMRATWIVDHLNAGVPMRALQEAAGLDQIRSLRRFLDFCEEISPERARQVLRQPAGADR